MIGSAWTMQPQGTAEKSKGPSGELFPSPNGPDPKGRCGRAPLPGDTET
jgi:hypothetical protein